MSRTRHRSMGNRRRCFCCRISCRVSEPELWHQNWPWKKDRYLRNLSYFDIDVGLRFWLPGRMANMSQTNFSSAHFPLKIFIFWSLFHWYLYLRTRCTICHFYRLWHGAHCLGDLNTSTRGPSSHWWTSSTKIATTASMINNWKWICVNQHCSLFLFVPLTIFRR